MKLLQIGANTGKILPRAQARLRFFSDRMIGNSPLSDMKATLLLQETTAFIHASLFRRVCQQAT
jgi:hypothetical protein